MASKLVNGKKVLVGSQADPTSSKYVPKTSSATSVITPSSPVTPPKPDSNSNPLAWIQGETTDQYNTRQGNNIPEPDSAPEAPATADTADLEDTKKTQQKLLEKKQKADEQEAASVNKQILGIQNGTIPLNAGEQAQIQGFQQSYNSLIEQQKLFNIGAQGSANIRGYQIGAAEYDPTFQAKTIGSIFTAGLNKVSELNVKMASAVAELTQSLKDNNIKAIKDAHKVYTDAAKERNDYIQKTVDDANTAIKEANDAFAKAQEAQQDRVDKANEALQDAIKNGAGSNQDVMAAMRAAAADGDVAGVLAAGADYIETGTGIVGEYLKYVRDAKLANKAYVDFNTYQDMDANRKRSIAQAANGAGLSNSAMTKVQGLAGKFETNQIVKDYNNIAQNIEALKTSGDTPLDDIQRIYSFAKIMDPNSVVREGEYKNVSDYAMALIEKTGKKINRVFDNVGFLTEEARQMMLETLTNRFAATEKAYNNLYDEYGRKIDKVTGMDDGKDYLTDYAQPFSSELLKTETDAENRILKASADPEVKKQALSYADKMNPETGLKYTAMEVTQILERLINPATGQPYLTQ